MATEKKTATFWDKIETIRQGATIFKVNKGKNYSYYKLSELLEVIEPLLKENQLRYEYSCNLKPVEHRAFLETTVTITDGTDSVSLSAYHELPENSNIMSVQQADNASATFGRKLALEMLLHVEVDDPVDNMAKEQGMPIPRPNVSMPIPKF